MLEPAWPASGLGPNGRYIWGFEPQFITMLLTSGKGVDKAYIFILVLWAIEDLSRQSNVRFRCSAVCKSRTTTQWFLYVEVSRHVRTGVDFTKPPGHKRHYLYHEHTSQYLSQIEYLFVS